jgi:hypothetical protein
MLGHVADDLAVTLDSRWWLQAQPDADVLWDLDAHLIDVEDADVPVRAAAPCSRRAPSLCKTCAITMAVRGPRGISSRSTR